MCACREGMHVCVWVCTVYVTGDPSLPHAFSNLAYALLGRCVLQTLYPGVSYEGYINQTILTPLGMTNTGFTFTDRQVVGGAVM